MLAVRSRAEFNSDKLVGGNAVHITKTPAAIRGWTSVLALAVFWFAVLVSAAAKADAPVRTAVFDFEFIDTSHEGEMFGAREDEADRLVMISELLRKLLQESGRYEVVDLAPAADEIKSTLFRGCNGCDAKIAGGLGAQKAITGTVQKVSNLILNINLYVRDVETRELDQVMSVDIRGNTDKSWSRGVSWLVRNRILKP